MVKNHLTKSCSFDLLQLLQSIAEEHAEKTAVLLGVSFERNFGYKDV